MANSGVSTPFTRTFFGDTPDDPPFFIGDRMTLHSLKSLNYVPGSAGWKINAQGDVEFNDVTLRGTLQSDNFVAGTSGWRLLDTGQAEFSDVTVRGSSVLAGASITGDLTMTASGRIRTSTTGARVEMRTGALDQLRIYPPNGTAYGSLNAGETGANDKFVTLSGPGSTAPYIGLDNNISTFVSAITINATTASLIGDNSRFIASASGAAHAMAETGTNAFEVSDNFTNRFSVQRDGLVNIETGASNSGYSLYERDNGSNRWIMYANTTYLRFWDGGDKAYIQRATGRIIAGVANAGAGAATIGPWNVTNTFAMFGNSHQINNSGNRYAIIQGAPGSGDERTYINHRSGWQIRFRNENADSNVNMIANIPSVAGPDPTMHISNTSHQFLRNTSSAQFKDVMADVDGDHLGHHNPIWKVRTVRYKWREGTIEGAADTNTRYPDGIHGFLAEDLGEAARDMVTWDADGKPVTPNDWAILAYAVMGLQHCHAGLRRRVEIEKDLALRLSRIEAVPAVAAALKKGTT